MKLVAAIPALFVCALFLLLVIVPVTCFYYKNPDPLLQCGGGIPTRGYCGTRSLFEQFPDSLHRAIELVEHHCGACHSLNDIVVGPPLKGSVYSDAYLTSLFYGKKHFLKRSNRHYKLLAKQYDNMNFHDQVKFPFEKDDKQRLFQFLKRLNTE